LKQMHGARDTGTPLNAGAFRQRVRAAVAEVVKKQLDCGLDIINDGEVGKSNFSRYARDRLSGFIERNAKPGEQTSTIFARDLVEFGEYFKNRTYHRGDNVRRVFCNAPLKSKTSKPLLRDKNTKKHFFPPSRRAPSSIG
jgi:5-methyltetrahydropteroyltriglutamate--homocysteine methyltransferase